MGITRHCFYISGKVPCMRLKLKMCERGFAISSPKIFIILVESPWISQLDLSLYLRIIFKICSCVVFLRFISGMS
jgi:hypothetical protein